MPLKLRYLQFCRYSFLLASLPSLFHCLLPLASNRSNTFRPPRFVFFPHPSYIFHCRHHHHLHIYIYIYIHTLTHLLTYSRIFMCTFLFKHLYIFTSSLRLLKNMTKSIIEPLFFKKTDRLAFYSFMFLFGYSSFIHIHVRNIQLLLVKKEPFLCACMLKLGF